MEMPIPILEQQKAPVTIPATSGKNANAKQADARQDSFKATFDKAMDNTDKGKTASAQGETESVQGEEKVTEEPCAQPGVERMFLVVVPPIPCQPAIELPTDAVLAAIESIEGVVPNNTTPDTGNGEMGQLDIPAIIPSETPVMVTPASIQKPNPVELTEIPKVQSGTQEVEITPVQNNSPSGDSAAKTVPVMLGQEESAPVQNTQPMPVEMIEKPVVTAAANPETLPDGKMANNEANIELITQPSVTTAVVTEAVEEKIAAMPIKAEEPVPVKAEETVSLKAEEQPAEKKGTLSKEALTAIAVPVAETTEQQSSAGGFNRDTSESPQMMTPVGAMPSAKAETVNVPFPAVEAPPPVKEQVFQEIVQKARFMSDGTQQQIQLQLKPEHLGLLNVQIAVENGAVTAKFQTDNPQVKQVLEASFNQLKQDLQTQGLKVQHVEVSIAQQGMSFSEFSRQAPQFSLIKSKRIGQGEVDAAEQALVQTSLIENYGGLHSGGVDYRI